MFNRLILLIPFVLISCKVNKTNISSTNNIKYTVNESEFIHSFKDNVSSITFLKLYGDCFDKWWNDQEYIEFFTINYHLGLHQSCDWLLKDYDLEDIDGKKQILNFTIKSRMSMILDTLTLKFYAENEEVMNPKKKKILRY